MHRNHRVSPPRPKTRRYHIYNVNTSWLWYCYDCDQHMKGTHHSTGHAAYLSWLWHSMNSCSHGP